jgi:hypothetical protein
MSNSLYGKGREKFGSGNINWVGDTMKVALIDTAKYTVKINQDEFFSAIPADAVVGTPVEIKNKTNVNGTMDGDDVTFEGIPATAPNIEAVVIYKDAGAGATSPLIAYIDTAAGLPLQPAGGNIIVSWDNGTNKIFTL